VIIRVEPGEAELASALGRASPLAKLGIALAWLVGLVFTTRVEPPLALAVGVLAVGWIVGRVPLRSLALGLLPLWSAAAGIAVFNGLFHPSNGDPSIGAVFALGPVRVTEPALAAAAGLGARVVAIASIGVVFARTTDATRLVDALVQQGRVPERFAYGALAAYQAIPRFAEDLATLRQARRIRGLRGGWHPRLLVGLLVLAIRHGDRLALAMDARAFGSGPRSRYRIVAWSRLDAAVAAGGAVVLAIVLALAAA